MRAALSVNGDACAQAAASDYPWTLVTAIDSVEISYLFYSEADNQNNGIVDTPHATI